MKKREPEPIAVDRDECDKSRMKSQGRWEANQLPEWANNPARKWRTALNDL